MNENTINERKKIDIGTGVQMSKYLHHKSPASQGNEVSISLLLRVSAGKPRIC